MQDYRQYDSEELAADPSFQRWQLADEPADRLFWTDWLRYNPDREEQVEKAAQLLTAISGAYSQLVADETQLSNAEVRAEIQQLHASLGEADGGRGIHWFTRPFFRYGLAASLLLLSLFGWYVLQSSHSGPGVAASDNGKPFVTYRQLVTNVTSPLVEMTNMTKARRVLNLPDRSTIILYPNSRVSYSKRFAGTRREVYLDGDAFFEVAKDPSRPFYVYTNNLVTKVLGTSFLVQTNEATRQVKVVVRTGRVSVYAQNQLPAQRQPEDYKLGGTVLTPNEQVVFSTTDTRLVRSLVSQPVLLDKDIHKQLFTFRRTPIAEVFAALEKAYNIRIVFDAEAMSNCYLTASLADEPLFDKLDLICHTLSARYHQQDTHIVIESTGCQ